MGRMVSLVSSGKSQNSPAVIHIIMHVVNDPMYLFSLAGGGEGEGWSQSALDDEYQLFCHVTKRL